MTAPRLVIVIPTRKRLDTFQATLATCLSQNYENFSVVVLPNASPDVVAYVSALSDSRVECAESAADLSMKDNWERIFDVPLSDDDFVFFLGDDDGLLPDALVTASNLIEQYQADILSWQKAEYCWPTMIIPEYQNLGIMPLSNSVNIVDTKSFLSQSHRLSIGYDRGPSIYASFVKMRSLRTLRQELSGPFFRSGSPDVFSSYTLATTCDSFVRTNFPLSINGASRHSNGISYINDFGSDANLMFSSSFEIHPSIVHAPSVFIAEADALLRARDAFPARFTGDRFSFESLVQKLWIEASTSTGSRSEALVAAAIEIARKNGVAAPKTLNRAESAPTQVKYGYRATPPSLTMNMLGFGASNVQEAAARFGAIDPLSEKSWVAEKDHSSSRKLIHRIRRKLAKVIGGV